MATRAIPKMDILECISPATEVAQRRVVGKDLDFIQTMIDRADALTIQAQNATDYIQLSKIIDNFVKLAKRAEEKALTLKEFSEESNPLTEINNSGELLEKVQLLSQAIDPQIINLKSQFVSNVKTQFDHYNASIDNLLSNINSSGFIPPFTTNSPNPKAEVITIDLLYPVSGSIEKETPAEPISDLIIFCIPTDI